MKRKFIFLGVLFVFAFGAYYFSKSHNSSELNQTDYGHLIKDLERDDITAEEINDRLTEIWFTAIDHQTKEESINIQINTNGTSIPAQEVQPGKSARDEEIKKIDFYSLPEEFHLSHLKTLIFLHENEQPKLRESDRLFCYQGISQMTLSAIVLSERQSEISDNEINKLLVKTKHILESKSEEVLARCQWKPKRSQVYHGAFVTLSGAFELLESNIYEKYIGFGEQTIMKGINHLRSKLKKMNKRQEKSLRGQYEVKELNEKLDLLQYMEQKISKNSRQAMEFYQTND